jgi:glycerophosphoryl diester phosphodiesterase
MLSSISIPVFAQMIVAHRGASFDAPENTLAAFQLAWEQNADGVEGDFYLTKDNQIVCIHDKDTLRTGGRKLVVADSTLEDLRLLEYGSWKDEKFRGEPIPTFADVMKIIPPGKRFVIELKTGPEIVPFLKEQLDLFKPNSKDLLIIAFNQETVAACKETFPNITAHWLTGYKQDKKTGLWSPTLIEVVNGMKKSKADGLGTQGNRGIVTEAFVEALKVHGLREFHVWTVDLPADANYFKKLGAMGITTNRPAFIRENLTN